MFRPTLHLGSSDFPSNASWKKGEQRIILARAPNLVSIVFYQIPKAVPSHASLAQSPESPVRVGTIPECNMGNTYESCTGFFAMASFGREYFVEFSFLVNT